MRTKKLKFSQKLFSIRSTVGASEKLIVLNSETH